jgi:hypothetical protein
MSPDQAAQVRKILDSAAFRNTEVLKKLLEYLSRQDSAADLKEYTVGIEAFGKPQDYDPRTDSSVRVQAGKLRLKLAEYYRTEGATDPVIIELPKGGFRLEVHERAVPAKPTRTPFWRGTMPVWLALMIAAIGIVGDRMVSDASREPAYVQWTPEMNELWRPLLFGGRPVMIAIGTPLFNKIGSSFFRDPTLNTWDAASQSDRLRDVSRALGTDKPAPAFTYTGVGEAAGAFELERIFLSRGREPALQTSDQLTWEDIGRHNMIFLGSPKYNQQTLDLPIHQDFEISRSHVQNLNPQPGEPRSYEEKWAADRTHLEEGHALISRLPGLHNHGEMLILAGSSTECTRAAVEYLTRSEYVTPFVRFLRTQPGGVPAWFQIVVRARFKSGTPIAIERVAFHALTSSPSQPR